MLEQCELRPASSGTAGACPPLSGCTSQGRPIAGLHPSRQAKQKKKKRTRYDKQVRYLDHHQEEFKVQNLCQDQHKLKGSSRNDPLVPELVCK